LTEFEESGYVENSEPILALGGLLKEKQNRIVGLLSLAKSTEVLNPEFFDGTVIYGFFAESHIQIQVAAAAMSLNV
jgi:hypothetical protein